MKKKVFLLNIFILFISCLKEKNTQKIKYSQTDDKRYLSIEDYKNGKESPKIKSMELPLVIDSSEDHNLDYFRHIPNEDFLLDMITSVGEAIYISENGTIKTWDEKPIRSGCYPYLIDEISSKAFIYLIDKKIDEIVEKFNAEYIVLSAGKICLDASMFITKIDNQSIHAPADAAEFLLGFFNKNLEQDKLSLSGPLSKKFPGNPTNKAATTIQSAFRKKRAKLKLKSKENSFLKQDTVSKVVEKIRSNDEISEENLAALGDEELLYTFRRFVNKKDSKGRVNFTEEMQETFEEALIERFQLSGKGFGSYYFDTTGVKNLVEYYKIVNPHLKKYDIKYILNEDGELPKDFGTGEGEKFFVIDTHMDEGEFKHVTMLYVNYDTKQAYSFDSFYGGQDRNKDLMKYQDALGSDFSVVSTTSTIQADTHNCMVFATSGISRMATQGKNLSTRLRKLQSEGVGTFDAVLPETLVMAQSMSLVKKYDAWFNFVSKKKLGADIKTLKTEFDEKYISQITVKYNQWKEEVGFDMVKNKHEKLSQQINSAQQQMNDAFQTGDNTLASELLLKWNRLKKESDSFTKIMNQNKKIEASIREAESFRDDWMSILHKDREYLAGVSNVRGRLEAGDGSIRVDEAGKEQNFMMERMRLRMLYYMATKHTLEAK